VLLCLLLLLLPWRQLDSLMLYFIIATPSLLQRALQALHIFTVYFLEKEAPKGLQQSK